METDQDPWISTLDYGSGSCSFRSFQDAQQKVLGIPIGFSADQNPIIFSMRIRIQEAKPMRIQADPDPDPGQTFKSQKVEFLQFLPDLFVNFWSISMLQDPDPHSQYRSGSGSKTAK